MKIIILNTTFSNPKANHDSFRMYHKILSMHPSTDYLHVLYIL